MNNFCLNIVENVSSWCGFFRIKLVKLNIFPIFFWEKRSKMISLSADVKILKNFSIKFFRKILQIEILCVKIVFFSLFSIFLVISEHFLSWIFKYSNSRAFSLQSHIFYFWIWPRSKRATSVRKQPIQHTFLGLTLKHIGKIRDMHIFSSLFLLVFLHHRIDIFHV
jgi:hypothetical protein